jgi:hypothetical protein
MKDLESKRINIRIPAYIQDYFKAQAKRYSVPYTNYITMVLTQNYEKEEEKELVREFNNVMKQVKEMSGDVTVEEMFHQLKQMKDIFSKLDN